MAAIVISISIENGVPILAAMKARRAIGTKPTSMAAVKIHISQAGISLPAPQAAASATPLAIVRRPLADFHHGPVVDP
ncbi:hypothetical protein RsS62_17110 [Rhizobium dioscoreae]|nr:hypothetical protein RsS62_17110 [Rhizobium dioscoreae]